jgi:hypothetical protein
MITDNHIEYLKQAIEPDDGYPHQWLWLNAEKYVLYNDLMLNGMYFADPDRLGSNAYAWEARYSSLRQDTVFFKNLLKCSTIRKEVHTEDEWNIGLDLQNVPIEKAIFEICYLWMNPLRVFSYDWRKLDVFREENLPPFPSKQECNEWNFLNTMFLKIIKEHLPMCTFEEFIEKEL